MAPTWPPPKNAGGACSIPRAYCLSGCTLLLGSALSALCHMASMYCHSHSIPQLYTDPQPPSLGSGRALCQERPFHLWKFNHLSGPMQKARPQEAL